MANTEYLKEWVRKEAALNIPGYQAPPGFKLVHDSFKLGGKGLGAALAGSAVFGGAVTGGLMHAAHKKDKQETAIQTSLAVTKEEKKDKENFNKAYGFGVGVGTPLVAAALYLSLKRKSQAPQPHPEEYEG